MITMTTTCLQYHNQLDNIKNENVTYYKQQIQQYLGKYGMSTPAKQAWKYFNTIDCSWKNHLHLPAHFPVSRAM